MTDLLPFADTLDEVRVVFAPGALSGIRQAIDDALAARCVMIVSTPGRSAMVERVRSQLEDRAVATFDRAAGHVPAALVANALEEVKETQADAVLAIGGGSAIGLGKALALRSDVVLAAVPTTYAGSEMTDIWGISDGDRKTTGRDARVVPRLVIYDPDLTGELPPEVAGPSGVNAIAHAVEALYAHDASPLSSTLAAEGLRRLAASLPLVVEGADDPSAYNDALSGAHLCGRALALTSMGLHHKLCHVLGGTLNLPHAPTHAVLLPYVTQYNADGAPEAMATIASCLDVPDAAAGLWHLNRELRVPPTLQSLGVDASQLSAVVEAVVRQPVENPVPVTADGVRTILEAAMDGGPPDARTTSLLRDSGRPTRGPHQRG